LYLLLIGNTALVEKSGRDAGLFFAVREDRKNVAAHGRGLGEN
jgi:hypothetical protein